MYEVRAPGTRVGRFFARVDEAAGGYAVDLTLYGLSAVFALVTALTSTLLPHRAWGSIAVWAYADAFLLAVLQFMAYRFLRDRPDKTGGPWRLLRRLVGNGGRSALTWFTWATAALLPLVVQAVQRADGRTDRAQEEVLVVEHMGERLLNDGTPYLSREAIAALPADERLMGYSPYQPGMSIFGLPRALAGNVWWTDARIWFALFTAAALITALILLRPKKARRPLAGRSFPIVRALQAVTVLPICALTLATGGDDIPVLVFCLLALAFAATKRYGWAGLAVGAAAACKLFALPVVVVLAILAIAVKRGGRLLPGALGLPILVLVPPFQVDQDAFLENVIRFPLGHGLITSPAQSPFPGYLIAQNVPGGRFVAIGLLLVVALAIAVRILRSPPRSADTASLICGWGLLAAILLMPTTRFGYLLYPAAFLVWAAALRPVHRNHTATSSPLDDTALYRL
ncbi:glycosyltransferase 87 family protein [Paractinoplanes ovalisporus]|uniref:glycosyltransferase 87 family protein n=1 Tax=Paractinoplanes ovalisporus TaxID=2810368 RepID=UPI0027DD7E65|nr:glycosyltransferase 87 family protein [Actinoplanes ovalisporus]